MTQLSFLFSVLALIATLTLQATAADEPIPPVPQVKSTSSSRPPSAIPTFRPTDPLIIFRPRRDAKLVAFSVPNVRAHEGEDRDAWHELDWKMVGDQFQLVRARKIMTGYIHNGPFLPGTGNFGAGPGEFAAECHLELEQAGTLPESQRVEWRGNPSTYLYPCGYEDGKKHRPVQVVCDKKPSGCLDRAQWDDQSKVDDRSIGAINQRRSRFDRR